LGKNKLLSCFLFTRDIKGSREAPEGPEITEGIVEISGINQLKFKDS
jgi:hypothetical protein